MKHGIIANRPSSELDISPSALWIQYGESCVPSVHAGAPPIVCELGSVILR